MGASKTSNYVDRGRRSTTLAKGVSSAELLALRNGPVWFVREDAASLRSVHLQRGKDPEPEAAPPLPGDPSLFSSLQDAVSRVREIMESKHVSDSEAAEEADKVNRALLAAIAKDPAGLGGITELVERLADIFTIRPSLQYANRRILIVLVLLWAKSGEIDIGRKLLDIVLAVLNSDLVRGVKQQAVIAETALTHLALAVLERQDGNRIDCMISLLDAWRSVTNGGDLYKSFVARLCCEMLEELGEIRDAEAVSLALSGPFDADHAKREDWILDASLWVDQQGAWGFQND